MAINLREYARGKPCKARIYGFCNNDPSTTVLHHIKQWRLFGTDVGISIKPDDLFAAWVCSGCHDYFEHEPRTECVVNTIEKEELHAMVRTQHQLKKDGVI